MDRSKRNGGLIVAQEQTKDLAEKRMPGLDIDNTPEAEHQPTVGDRLQESAKPEQEPLLRELLEDQHQHEESLRMGLLLALSIGILNACTYMTRGHVFASSQSGNLLYLGMDLAAGEFSNVLKYAFPPLMFGIGIVAAEHYKDAPNYPDWRKYPFFAEIVLIVAATLMPDSWNALANPLFGLCCGLQSITFHKIRHTPVQTVFINGSFQNALIHWVRFLHLSDHQDAFRSLLYLLIVAAYLAGIVLGGVLVPVLHHYVSMVSALILLGCCFFLHPITTHRS